MEEVTTSFPPSSRPAAPSSIRIPPSCSFVDTHAAECAGTPTAPLGSSPRGELAGAVVPGGIAYVGILDLSSQLVRHGVAVLAFNVRGMGGSPDAPLANVQSWLAPAVNHYAQTFHAAPTEYVQRVTTFYTAAPGPDRGEA